MDNLFLCRQIMRIYTCYGFDMNTHRLIKNICPNILETYSMNEYKLKQIFNDEFIEMYPCGVNSNFDGVDKVEVEVFFIYKKYKYVIPNNLIMSLKDFLIKNKLSISQSNFDVSLYFGYTGRYFKRQNDSILVTDGLQRALQKDIILDFEMFQNANYTTFHHRLVHELLHVLGISEEQMPSIIVPACIYTEEISKVFIKELQSNCSSIYDEFKRSVCKIQKNNIEITYLMNDLCEQLFQQNGFFESPENIVKCTSYIPVSFKPIEVKGIDILFM